MGIQIKRKELAETFKIENIFGLNAKNILAL